MDTVVRKALSSMTKYLRWMVVIDNVSGEPQQMFTNLIRLYRYVKTKNESGTEYELGSIEDLLMDSILDHKRGIDISGIKSIEITAYQRNKG